MVVRMRHTRSHTANRRSHHALKARNLVACSKCKALIMPHRMCDVCGSYNGKTVLNTMKKVEKKTKKATAKK